MNDLLCLITITWTITIASTMTVEFQAEYFTNTTLQCDDKLLNLPYTPFKKYWLTPNGTIIQWSHNPGNWSRFVVGDSPDFNLTISYINDEDFGWYYCVILWDNYIYLVHSIKVGLNVDGALYPRLNGHYLNQATIGLIAGGSVAALVTLLCLLYWCKYSEVNTRNKNKKEITEVKEKLDSVSTVSENETLKETEVIYELDKAVKVYDDENAITENNLEQLSFANRAYVDENLDENRTSGQNLEARFNTEEETLEATGNNGKLDKENKTVAEGRSESSQEHETFTKDGDGYSVVPPPPPLPPPLPEHHRNIFDENNEDEESSEGNYSSATTGVDAERRYMFQEELIEHIRERFHEDVAF